MRIYIHTSTEEPTQVHWSVYRDTEAKKPIARGVCCSIAAASRSAEAVRKAFLSECGGNAPEIARY